MQNKKICIIGNSVALRVRPTEKHPENKNYFQLLQDEVGNNDLFYNLACGAQTVKDIYKEIDNYIRIFPSYYIINLGVVDSSTREVPLWFYRLSTKKSLNPFFVFWSLFYRSIIAKFRIVLVKLRGKTSWISENKFENYFELILQSLLKETNAKIIILSINEANERIESQLPGSLKKHKAYNKIMNKLADKYNQDYLNTNKLIGLEDYPDGVHFSITGHKKIAKKLSSIIYSVKNNK